MKTTRRIKVTYFINETAYCEHVDTYKECYIDACQNAMERVKKATPNASNLIAQQI